MRSILLATLPVVLFAKAPVSGPTQPLASTGSGAKDEAPKATPLKVEPKDLAKNFRFEAFDSSSGTVEAIFTCVTSEEKTEETQKTEKIEVGSTVRVPLSGDQPELARARWTRVDGSDGGAISTSKPRPSWSEILGTGTITLDRNQLLEFFRINAFRPVSRDDIDREKGKKEENSPSWFRVVLLCTAPIKRKGEQNPIIPKGTRVFCLGEMYQGNIYLRFSEKNWSGHHAVLGPQGIELEAPVVILPSCEGLDLRDLETLSTDDLRTIGWWMRGQGGIFFRTAKKTSLPLYSSPADIQLYAGATWSNLYVTPSQGGSSNFFSERGLLRLEATQSWMDTSALWFFQSVVAAQVEPDKAVEVKDLAGVVTAIRTSRGFLGALDLSLGYALFLHTNVGVGIRWSAQQERIVPLDSAGHPDPTVPPLDQVVNQRHFFFRLQQQDPQWRGSFFEIGLKTNDERFRDPEVPDNEHRRFFRGRVAFRPEQWSATSFFLEASMNRATNNRSKLPEESRIQVGFRVDLKTFSTSVWPF